MRYLLSNSTIMYKKITKIIKFQSLGEKNSFTATFLSINTNPHEASLKKVDLEDEDNPKDVFQIKEEID